MEPESITTLAAWTPSIIAFGVISGAINGLMTAMKKMVAGSSIERSVIYRRMLPILPALLGAAVAPFIGDNITPIDFELPVKIAAGFLMGSLSAHVYAVWESNVKNPPVKQ